MKNEGGLRVPGMPSGIISNSLIFTQIFQDLAWRGYHYTISKPGLETNTVAIL
jgi:hypothetical protein